MNDREVEYVRNRFETTKGYKDLIDHFPEVKAFLDNLPIIKRRLVVQEVYEMFCSALEEIRNGGV